MEYREADRSNQDHGAFKNRKGNFIVGQVAVEAFAQFSNSEGRSYQNAQCRDTQP